MKGKKSTVNKRKEADWKYTENNVKCKYFRPGKIWNVFRNHIEKKIETNK